MYAELRIGDSIITVNDEMPEFDSKAPDPSSPVPISLTIYCEDTDALYAQALEAGATQVREPKDAFFGDRVGTLRDPFGHKWAIATHLRDMTSEELEEAMQQAFA
jgi:PhnB protein